MIRRPSLILPIMLTAAAGISGCDEARTEYEYTLSSPPASVGAGAAAASSNASAPARVTTTTNAPAQAAPAQASAYATPASAEPAAPAAPRPAANEIAQASANPPGANPGSGLSQADRTAGRTERLAPGEVELPVPQALEIGAGAISQFTGLREEKVAGLAFNIPAEWTRAENPGPMRAASFTVPAPEAGGEPAELTVFHFGPGQGGAANDNLKRWLRQVTPEPGSPAPERYIGVQNGLRLSVLHAWGTYIPAAMGGQPAKSKPGTFLLGLVAEQGPQGTVFFRLVGPEPTVTAASQGWGALVVTIRPENRTMEDLLAADRAAQMSSVAPPNADGTAPEFTGPDGERRVQVAGVNFAVPADWKQEVPANQMRVAQFAIPAKDAKQGDPKAEVVVFHFGPGQGGTAQENVARWVNQMRQPGGGNAQEKAQLSYLNLDGGLRITEVTVNGAYTPQQMDPNQPPPQAIPNARLHGLVIEGGPRGTVFIRCVGPEPIVSANQAGMRALAESVRGQ